MTIPPNHPFPPPTSSFHDDDLEALFAFLSEPFSSPFTLPIPSDARKRPRPDDDVSSSPTRSISPKRSPSTSPHSTISIKFDNSEQSTAFQEPKFTCNRRLWVKERSREWWDRLNSPDCPEEEFRGAFRMSRETFEFLCDQLASAVAKEDTTLRAAIPVRQRVAVCIWRLATGEPLRLVSKRFGLGISTCHKLILDVCAAIKSVLMPKAVVRPSNSEAISSNAARFEAISGMPGVVGSIYTIHIPIVAPKENVAAYFNRRQTERNQKTSYSNTVQGVVNPDGVFTDVCIGWPGSMPDEQVLEKSALYQRASSGMLNSQWIVGGVSYPLMDWTLVPYAQSNLTWAQHAFNERIGEIERVAKDAFARLKGRWGCLQKRSEVKLQDLPVVLGACIVLHNICELGMEEIDPELHFDLTDDEIVPENRIRSVSAMQARDSIAHNLLHCGRLGGMNMLVAATCMGGWLGTSRRNGNLFPWW